MTYSLQNKLTILSYCQEKWKNTLPIDDKEVLLAKMQNCLELIFFELPDSFTPFLIPLKEAFLESLTFFKQKNIKPFVDENLSLKETIDSVKNALKSIPLFQKDADKKTGNEVFAFICDIDCDDFNGSFHTALQQIIEDGIPFITTRTILKNSGSKNSRLSDHLENQFFMKKGLQKWEIYEQKHLESEGFLVCIPESFYPHLSSFDKLDYFGFDPDVLKPIPLEDAFKSRIKNYTFKPFIDLFTGLGKEAISFYLCGHGGSGYIGGLSKDNFMQFTSWLNNIKCKSLIISSCYAGGKSLLNLWKPAVQSFDLEETPIKYPILVENIGDLTSFMDTSFSFKKVLNAITSGLNATPSKQLFAIQQNLKNLSRIPHCSHNNFQIFFPHSGPTISGYKAIDEFNEGFVLNYNKIKARQLNSFKKKIRAYFLLELEKKLYLNVQFIPLPILFKECNPLLISLIPGNANHFFHSIYLEKIALVDYWKNVASFYEEGDLDASKAFFINKVKNGKQTYKKVVFHQHKKESFLLYKKKENFFLKKGEIVSLITPFQFYLYSQEIMLATNPDPTALKVASGGHEIFENKENDFFSSFEKEEEQITQLRKTPPSVWKRTSLTTSEIIDFIFYLTNEKDKNLTFITTILIHYEIDPNSKNFQGVPLICRFVEKNLGSCVFLLLKKYDDIKLNVKHPLYFNRTSLAISLQNRSTYLSNLLLKQPNINLNETEDYGIPILARAIMNDFPITSFKDIPLITDVFIDNQHSLLSWFISMGLVKEAKRLLDMGANPNYGKPNGMEVALLKDEMDLVELMVKNKGDPFKGQNGPFIEVILHGSQSALNYLIELPTLDLNTENSRGINPLLAALIKGDEKLIESLIKRGAILPEIGSQEIIDIFTNVLKNAYQTKGIKRIEEFCIYFKNDREYKKIIVEYLWSHNVLELFKLITSKTITIDDKTIISLFKKSICTNNEKFFYKLVKILTISKLPEGFNYFAYYLKMANYISPRQAYFLLKDLLKENLLPPVTVFFSDELYRKVIGSLDLEFIQLVCHYLNISAFEQKEKFNQFFYFATSEWALKENPTIAAWFMEQGVIPSKDRMLDLVKYGGKDLVCQGIKMVQDCDYLSELLEEAAKLDIDPEKLLFKELVFTYKVDMNAGQFTNPFCTLCYRVDSDLINWCIQHGANVNPEVFITPLQIVAKKTNTYEGQDAFKALVQAGAKLTSNHKDAFVEVCKHADGKFVKWCLRKESKLLDHEGYLLNPVTIAKNNKNEEVAELLLQEGFEC